MAALLLNWQSYDQDGSQWGVYGQRYDSAGAAVGSEFLVNDSGASTSEERASIVELSDGGFIVVWRSSNDDIYSQRFDADGDKVGSQVRVNTNTNGSDRNPDVVIGPFDGGGYVVTWMNSSRDGSDWGVFGQRFDANGNAVGSEFQVNTTTSNRQWRPDVATFSDGSFVVVWNSRDQDGSDIGVFGQRFDANGTAVGDEFQVNTQTESNQMRPAVAELADGGFAVTWQSGNQDGSAGIYAQRYVMPMRLLVLSFGINATTNNDWSIRSITSSVGRALPQPGPVDTRMAITGASTPVCSSPVLSWWMATPFAVVRVMIRLTVVPATTPMRSKALLTALSIRRSAVAGLD